VLSTSSQRALQAGIRGFEQLEYSMNDDSYFQCFAAEILPRLGRAGQV